MRCQVLLHAGWLGEDHRTKEAEAAVLVCRLQGQTAVAIESLTLYFIILVVGGVSDEILISMQHNARCHCAVALPVRVKNKPLKRGKRMQAGSGISWLR
jgi:hypothetical protein